MTPNDVFLSECRQGAANPNCPDPNGPDYDFGNAPVLTRLPHGRDVIVIGQKSGVGFALDPEKKGAVLWQYRAGLGGALGGIEWGSGVDANHASQDTEHSAAGQETYCWRLVSRRHLHIERLSSER